jgi:hypothetical protein
VTSNDNDYEICFQYNSLKKQPARRVATRGLALAEGPWAGEDTIAKGNSTEQVGDCLESPA